MKRTVLVVGVLALVFAGAFAFAEGTATTSENPLRPMRVSTISWSVLSNGWATATVKGISGDIQRILLPAQADTNTYDLTLVDSGGLDILFGRGIHAGSTNPISLHGNTNFPFATDGNLALTVTNSVALTNGSCLIYHR